METIKQEIKRLAEMQVVLRDQRKTVYNKLDRTIESSVAAGKHSDNRFRLRILYAAYGLLKGKSLEEVKENYGTSDCYFDTFDSNKTQIDSIVSQHKLEFEKNEKTICANL